MLLSIENTLLRKETNVKMFALSEIAWSNSTEKIFIFCLQITFTGLASYAPATALYQGMPIAI